MRYWEIFWQRSWGKCHKMITLPVWEFLAPNFEWYLWKVHELDSWERPARIMSFWYYLHAFAIPTAHFSFPLLQIVTSSFSVEWDTQQCLRTALQQENPPLPLRIDSRGQQSTVCSSTLGRLADADIRIANFRSISSQTSLIRTHIIIKRRSLLDI